MNRFHYKFLRDSICASMLLMSPVLLGCSDEPSSPIAEANADESPPEKAQKEDSPKTNSGHDKKKHTNRLAKETSPYLLLHAHNPVDWYPWGEEALAKAKKENKLIFLSIGYSSCHWCHVMERESFLDKEIAALMNKHFVCIKVDREERPDIDKIYMTALNIFNQLTRNGRGGGWPLSMFLAPDARPIMGGTYFPARDGDRGNSIGFLTLLRRIHQGWINNADGMKRDAETITKFTKVELEGSRPDPLVKIDEALVNSALEALESQYDEQYGGFGYNPRNPGRPKFPEPSNLVLLLDRATKAKNDHAKEMLLGTLERMAMGGIRDHLGGGFHRYSVDRFWKIPHFEKMLYDNGQLASVYTEAYLLSGREDFRRVVDEMLTFVLREMTHEGGGFYAALDAESENEEGKYYRWDKDHVEKILTKEEFDLFGSIYGLHGEPNFEEHYYAPQFDVPLRESAKKREIDEETLDEQLAPIRSKLLKERDKRIRPLTDTKILTSWNGLMIRGFADAGRGLKNKEYIEAAERAADFVLAKLRTGDGRLQRTYSQGEAKLNAYLNDYAFMVDGLIALFRATEDKKWLDAANELTKSQIEFYYDENGGGFFFTSDDHESLLARAKNPYDGAQPSGNSVSAHNLVYLGVQLEQPDYLKKAEKTIRSVSSLLQRAPAAAPRMMVAISDYLDATKESAE